MALGRQKLRKICDFSYGHKAQFNFAMQKKEHTSTVQNHTVIGGIIFSLEGFLEPEHITPITADILYSGEPVYMTIKSSVPAEMTDKFKFTPHKCLFIKSPGDQIFTLFDKTVNQCQQEWSELDFQLDFQASDRTWNFSYRLFTFGENTFSKYRLECDIYACYDGSDNNEDCRSTAALCDDDYQDNADIWRPSCSINYYSSDQGCLACPENSTSPPDILVES